VYRPQAHASVSRRGTYTYTCSLYQQSDAKVCSHNTLPGPAAARFVLSCIRQRAMTPDVLQRLTARLREMAEAEFGVDHHEAERESAAKNLRKVEHQMDRAARNLALAESDAERQALRGVFNELRASKEELERRLDLASRTGPERGRIEDEVAQAMAGLGRLADLAESPDASSATQELFAAATVKLYVGFEKVERGSRTVNVLAGGVLTLGAADPPVPLYNGPTDKRIIRKHLAKGEADSLVAGTAAKGSCGHHDGPEDQGSSGNVARRTPRCTRPAAGVGSGGSESRPPRAGELVVRRRGGPG
jgi:hypothetical protein